MNGIITTKVLCISIRRESTLKTLIKNYHNKNKNMAESLHACKAVSYSVKKKFENDFLDELLSRYSVMTLQSYFISDHGLDSAQHSLTQHTTFIIGEMTLLGRRID